MRAERGAAEEERDKHPPAPQKREKAADGTCAGCVRDVSAAPVLGGSPVNGTRLLGDLCVPDVYVFLAGGAVALCVLQQQQQQTQQGPNERCLNTDTSWAVLSGSFKRVTGIYLVTERVTGCFS